MISVVTPWRTLLSAFGLIGNVKSECVLMSMKPGHTTSSEASMVFAADEPSPAPIAAMRPSRMPMSPANGGAPEPSTMRPPRIRISNGIAASCGEIADAGEHFVGALAHQHVASAFQRDDARLP